MAENSIASPYSEDLARLVSLDDGRAREERRCRPCGASQRLHHNTVSKLRRFDSCCKVMRDPTQPYLSDVLRDMAVELGALQDVRYEVVECARRECARRARCEGLGGRRWGQERPAAGWPPPRRLCLHEFLRRGVHVALWLQGVPLAPCGAGTPQRAEVRDRSLAEPAFCASPQSVGRRPGWAGRLRIALVRTIASLHGFVCVCVTGIRPW